MKRLCCILLFFCMIAWTGFSLAFAADVRNIMVELRPDYTIIIDGVERTFYSVSGEEVQPMYCNGTSYLPIRAIGELMGKNVNWDQSTLTVTIAGSRQTAAVVGTSDKNASVEKVTAEIRPDFTIVIDGTVREFKDANGAVVYPILYDGITYLPLRAIGEIMGKTVGWDPATSTITLSRGAVVTDADTFHQGGQSGTPGNLNQPTQPSLPANLKKPSTPSTIVAPPATGDIGSERAKEIALKHAGVSAADVQLIQVERDYDNGRWVYEVEFYTTDYREYDYEIDASFGQIVSYDCNAGYHHNNSHHHGFVYQNQNQSGTQIYGSRGNCHFKGAWCYGIQHHSV